MLPLVHIGLYLATPAAIGVLGNSFDVLKSRIFHWSLAGMIFVFFVAGAHAAWFMGKYINIAWDESFLRRFEDDAFSRTRRILHHWLYWLGLVIGLGGLAIAAISS